MNLIFLETFLKIIETGNLNKAAERLNVTQSTVTTRIDALEETLGRRLMVRSRRGTRLTRAGFELRPHAELLVHGWAQARKAINLPKGYSGLFSFACEFDLWHDVGLRWIYATREAHPELAYEARPGRRTEITAWLGSGLTDVAMTMEPLSGSGLVSRHLCDQRIVHVSTKPPPLATPDPEYVFVDMGPDFRRQHSSAFPEASTAGMTFSVSGWALEHLRAHGGSAYLPHDLVEPLLAQQDLHLVPGSPEFIRAVHLVWRETVETVFPWLFQPA